MAIRYLVTDEKGNGHLPVSGEDGKPDHHLMGAAFAALYKNYRGNSYEGPGKEEAKSKLKALYKSEGMDWPSETSADGQIGRSAGGAERAADGPQMVALLGAVVGDGPIRIPIAITGQWKGAENKFSIGLDDLEEIRKNFSAKPTGEVNVDYEHASEVPFGTGGPVLSAGRVVALDPPEKYPADGQVGRSADGGRYILWGQFEPTARARELIAAKEYRYISPAIRWGAKDKVTGKTIGTVLTSVALVNKPFLEDLPPIQESAGSPLVTPHSSLFSETIGNQKVFVSLGQLHIPAPVNSEAGKMPALPQVSVANQQPDNAGPNGVRPNQKENTTMAKSLKLKCLTDAHLEKHNLPASHLGKIGVFDGDELMGVAEAGPDGWEKKQDETEAKAKACELFASEVGLTGKSLVDIAAMVSMGKKHAASSATVFEAIEPALDADGRIALSEVASLGDKGRLSLGTILKAQEGERLVNEAVRQGKVLPKNRKAALKLALSDGAAFATFVQAARPVLDLRSLGNPEGGEVPTSIGDRLMTEVNAYAAEHKVSVAVALSEVTKAKPDLWRQYNAEVKRLTDADAADEEE